MLFRRAVCALIGLLALTSLVTSQAQLVTPKPDLTVTEVIRANGAAYITVRNIGSANAPQCIMKAYYWNGHGWGLLGSQYVTLPQGAIFVRVMYHPNFTTAQYTKVVIDTENVVNETNEMNNTKYDPEPSTN